MTPDSAPLDLHGPEQIVAQVRLHGRNLTFPVVLFLLLAGASGAMLGAFAEPLYNIGFAVLVVVLFVFGVCGPVLKWLTRRTTVTTHRVITRSGVFTRHRAEVPFTRIRTVATRQSLGQRMIGSGDIELDIVDGRNLVLEDVPGLAEVSEVLHQLVERSYRAETRAQRHASGFFTGGGYE